MSRWRTCCSWLLPLGILGAVACSRSEQARAAGATRQAEPAIDPRSVAGTYELRVCRLACPADPDSATARAVGATLRRGYLVLSDTPTGFELRKDSIGILLGGFMSPPSNGCFKLDIVRADPPS